MKTKEEWKEIVLEFLEKNKDQNISIMDIFSMHNLVPMSLKGAVEELENEDKIVIVKDDKNKKWLRHKDAV